MAAPNLDAEIDRLFQLPLGEFTAARNALAKEAGARGSEVRALQKPPIPAWAVNQIYWRDRDTYDALAGAARDLRNAHAAVLAGKKADLRAASRVHEEALEAAVKSALDLLRSEGHPATEATKQAVLTTLRALPSDEAPGRLTRTLQPGGFEMLAGLPIRPGAAARPAARVTEAPRAPRAEKAAKEETAAAARKKEEAAEAARALRMAEHAAKREEFEAARAAREAEKANRAVESARAALEEAERTLKEAEQAAADAEKARTAADRRSREAEAALKAAKARVSAR